MGMHEYLKSLSDLEMINRAPGYFKFEEHNVAAHSFKVRLCPYNWCKF